MFEDQCIQCYDKDHGDLTAVFQRSPITKALNCMKIYLCKQNGNVVNERNTSDYFVIQAIYESYKINLQPNRLYSVAAQKSGSC